MSVIRHYFDRAWDWLFGRPAPLEASDDPAAPTDWCLVGNIVEEHAFGESKEMRRGSKHFTAGTKVYCLPAQWGNGYEKAVVVGLSRGSRRWITVVMPIRYITNWRAKVVYKPAVLRRLREGFKGFKCQWKSRAEVEAVAEGLRKRDSGGEQPPAGQDERLR